MCKLLLLLLALPLFGCNSSSEQLIKISTKQGLDLSLITYSGFTSDTLRLGRIHANETMEVPVDYRGFALMLIDEIYPYPLIIGKEGFEIAFTSALMPPVFTRSPENSFFYDFHSAYNELSKRIWQVEKKKQDLGATDPFYHTMQSQLDTLYDKKRTLANQLPDNDFPQASAILQAKLIEEKSHGIKTLNELHTTQNNFVEFATENFQYLYHSDRLNALINQSFMMLEYINYFDQIEKTGDKGTDISRGQALFRQEMIRQAGIWIDALKPYLDPGMVLAQCVKIYYNRSMIRKAYEIQNAFSDMAVCYFNTTNKRIDFPDTFEIVKSDAYSILSSSQIDAPKMIIIVDDQCVFSKVFAIIKARELEECNTAIIILPKGELNQSILLMDRNCVKQLYFIKNKKWIDKEALGQVNAPAIIQLN